MAITYQEAVALIGDRARRGAFDDAAVQSLALCFKTVRLSFRIPETEAGGIVAPYAVVGDYNVGVPKLEFKATAPNGEPIPSVLLVPMVYATDMDQVEVTEKLLRKITVPAFRAPPNPLTRDSWKLLDLDVVNPPAHPPRVILTPQFSGCTFAIGTVGRKYYMGHAKNPPGSTEATVGGHAKNLRKGPVFNGLPPNTKLESTFFIQPGTKNDKNDANTFRYVPSDNSINVLGFVVGTKVSFIVVMVNKSQAIEKVFVLTQASASKWNIKQV